MGRLVVATAFLLAGCSSKSSHPLADAAGYRDFALPPADLSELPDLSGGTDLAAQPDLAGAMMSGCSEMINCINGCQDNTCRQNCFNSGTPTAQQLYNDLSGCLRTACPGTNANDVCFMITPQCTQCYTDAQQTGACVMQSQACSTNM